MKFLWPEVVTGRVVTGRVVTGQILSMSVGAKVPDTVSQKGLSPLVSILAVGLYQVAKFHVGVAIAGIAVRLFRLRRRGDDRNGFLRAVMDAGQTVLAIAFRNTLFGDDLPRAVRTD